MTDEIIDDDEAFILLLEFIEAQDDSYPIEEIREVVSWLERLTGRTAR